ncbi:MAG: protein-L-isoaspartate O-methyltransferase [Legionellales bacterium]|nr:protein-L-isoaspartate O-methyltransferase [Legionellales bacterium]|tara:strand:- start:2032 stop:2655 length:624 start_codon:yes stop_codon:yes gene_type:complete
MLTVEAIEQQWHINDHRVAAAMAKVPREQFVSEDLQSMAYDNRPLPIGYNQTISQPFIVGLMTAYLSLEPDHKVLEVGTGCGYQAAVLAEMVSEVYSLDCVSELVADTAVRLTKLKYKNIRLRVSDGHEGWPGESPFDRIIVTAAAQHCPPALLDQLAPNGILVLPLAEANGSQSLWRITKDVDGVLSYQQDIAVRFVPLISSNKGI